MVGELIRRQATHSLCRLAPVSTLARLAADEDVNPETRLQAAITLRKLGHSAQAVAVLYELAELKGTTPTLQFRAATELPTRRRKRKIRRILGQLLRSADADEWIREAAAMRLSDL